MDLLTPILGSGLCPQKDLDVCIEGDCQGRVPDQRRECNAISPGVGWKEELPSTTEKFVPQNGETKNERGSSYLPQVL